MRRLELLDIIKYRLLKRVRPILNELYKILGSDFTLFIAGNSLNKNEPNDFDLYAGEDSEFDLLAIKEYSMKHSNCEYITDTKNALTIKINGLVVQFCKYKKFTLQELVDSFDFAHIQIGASLIADNGMFIIDEVYYSENWEKAKILETTFYTEPEIETSYPLASLLRCFKYKERGDFGDKSYIAAVLTILKQLVSRGFEDYDDFKDQLEAVDLQLLNEEEGNAAWDLFNILNQTDLVRNKKHE